MLDLFTLNGPFHMETVASLLGAMYPTGWVVPINLKVPLHIYPGDKKLRLVCRDKAFHLSAPPLDSSP